MNQPRKSNGQFASTGAKTKRSRSRKAKPQLVNRFAIVLDASGSMNDIWAEAIAAYNRCVESIRQTSQKYDQKSTVTLVTFGERGHNTPLVKLFDADVEKLTSLTARDYIPSGNTQLNDAVGTAIEQLDRLKDTPQTSYVVFVITDGEENASRRFSYEQIRDLMAKKVATDRWTFAWSVAPHQKAKVNQTYQVPIGNIQEWEPTSTGARLMADSYSVSTMSFGSAARSAGKGISTKSFYVTTDMSQVKPEEVKQKLTDIQGNTKIWSVNKEVPIREFVEEKMPYYNVGSAYYQLTKSETIQPQKQVLLMEKGKRAVYGGPEARRVIGLPDWKEADVTPGNHANWDIYVQSTSANRKLVRGTRVIYVTQ